VPLGGWNKVDAARFDVAELIAVRADSGFRLQIIVRCSVQNEGLNSPLREIRGLS
jgi:hypothetical protein